MKTSNGKSPCGKKELRVKLGPVCFATLLALGMVQTAGAAIKADTSAANQPGIHTSTSGATVVDINKASSDGVSHNIYSEFNVDKNGVVLNNSTVNTNTQQAGNINGNANLAGNSATIILNEVRSSDPSQLNGMVEVAGKSAQVIIANPSGITCDGCGFINTNHATLTTGTANFDETGKLTGFDVKKGQVVVTGAGMDVGNNGKPQMTDIYARSVKVNAQLQAKNLNIITGTNRIKTNGTVEKTIEGTGSAPAMALDVSSLGSMYAGKITMVGTESGVGVRLDNADITAQDTLTISTAGNIENRNSVITAGHSLNISGQSVDNTNGEIRADAGNINIDAIQSFSNHNGTISGDTVNIKGGYTDNTGGLIESKGNMSLNGFTLDNRDGVITSGNELWVGYNFGDHYDHPVDGINNENGVLASTGSMYIQTADFNNNSGLVTTDGVLSLYADNLVNTHSDDFVASDRWDNASQKTGGIYAGEGAGSDVHTHYATNESSINVRSLNNEAGRIVSTGKDTNLRISSSGTIDNTNGVIDVAKSLSVDQYGHFNNGNGKVTAAEDVNFNVADFASGSNGEVKAGNNVNIQATNTFNNEGTISAAHDVLINIENTHRYADTVSYNKGQITAGGAMTVQSQWANFVNEGTMSSNGALNWNGGNATNKGTIHSNSDIRFAVDTLTNAQGATISGESVTVSGKVDNKGTITPDYVPDNGGNPDPYYPDSHDHDDGGHTPAPTPDYPDHHAVDTNTHASSGSSSTSNSHH
ncbi:filamentous hemagglutinin N-terminal domain-containing protein [Cronobacter dublinensis]|uniref:filamentous hemagglutinin N-terminal domain-containing protein n=1 Tax=Cronobacter dublinensis TaxID=413497 RepID=UPI000CFAAB1F|nr:filamentous hemagglutinin N-terminal domain-containing protein [Cronobacter dublinensis]